MPQLGKFTASQIYRLTADNGKAAFDPERVGAKGAGYTAFVNDQPVSKSFATVAEYNDWVKTERERVAVYTLSVGAKSYVEEVAMNMLFADDPEFEPDWDNIHMRRGNQRELAAVSQFDMVIGCNTQCTGDDQQFIDCGKWGATPDGIIDGKVTMDVKSPTRAKHLKYIMEIQNQDDLLRLEPGYYWQQQCQIAALGKSDYGYWASYNPMANEYAARLHVIKVHRDQQAIDRMLIKIDIAFDYLASIILKVKGL